MDVIYATKQELEELRSEIQSELKNHFKGKHFSGKKLLKSSQVRELLNVSISTLQNLRSNGTIPFTKVGGHTLYAYEDILEILEKNLVSTNITNN